MKNENVGIVKKNLSEIEDKKISRKEAIKRTGYIAVSAATMMLLLSTHAQAEGSHDSAAPPPKRDPKPDCSGGKRGPWK
jgi:hypothetical protein